jgi:hypothetical protein
MASGTRNDFKAKLRKNVVIAKWFSLLLLVIFVQRLDADDRRFRMALWNNPNGTDADVSFFTEGGIQPNGSSILLISSWSLDNFAEHWESLIRLQKYDVSRIESVVVDEPYWSTLGTANWSNPCRDKRKIRLRREEQLLRNAALAIKRTSRQIRFWVNFSEPEVQWIMDPQCPAPLIQNYIDVISMDVYWKSFGRSVQPYYNWLIAHRTSPGQQFALIPGAFYREGVDDQIEQASLLKGYFDYAKHLNEKCELPLGQTGTTGKADRCLVWVVVGWLGPTVRDSHGVVWHGELDPQSTFIRAIWRASQRIPLHQP